MKNEIIQHLRIKGLTNKQLAESLNASTDVVRVLLWRLQKDGIVRKGNKNGREFLYKLINGTPNVTNVTPNVTNVTPNVTVNQIDIDLQKGNSDRLRMIHLLVTGKTTRLSGEELKEKVLELIEDVKT